MSPLLRSYIVMVTSILFIGTSSIGDFSSAHAHMALVNATPKPGKTVTESPEVISLKFSGKPITVMVHLFDGDDNELDNVSKPVLDGRKVTIPLISELPNGAYKVTIRAVSKDGHVVESAIKFTVEIIEQDSDTGPIAATTE